MSTTAIATETEMDHRYFDLGASMFFRKIWYCQIAPHRANVPRAIRVRPRLRGAFGRQMVPNGDLSGEILKELDHRETESNHRNRGSDPCPSAFCPLR